MIDQLRNEVSLDTETQPSHVGIKNACWLQLMDNLAKLVAGPPSISNLQGGVYSHLGALGKTTPTSAITACGQL